MPQSTVSSSNNQHANNTSSSNHSNGNNSINNPPTLALNSATLPGYGSTVTSAPPVSGTQPASSQSSFRHSRLSPSVSVVSSLFGVLSGNTLKKKSKRHRRGASRHGFYDEERATGTGRNTRPSSSYASSIRSGYSSSCSSSSTLEENVREVAIREAERGGTGGGTTRSNHRQQHHPQHQQRRPLSSQQVIEVDSENEDVNHDLVEHNVERSQGQHHQQQSHNNNTDHRGGLNQGRSNQASYANNGCNDQANQRSGVDPVDDLDDGCDSDTDSSSDEVEDDDDEEENEEETALRSKGLFWAYIVLAPLLFLILGLFMALLQWLPSTSDGYKAHWDLFALGMAGWAVSFAIRTPLYSCTSKLLHLEPFLSEGSTLFLAGSVEEAVRAICIVNFTLGPKDFGSVYWIGLGWAGVETVYYLGQSLFYSRWYSKAEAKDPRARNEVRQMLGMDFFHTSPWWSIMGRTSSMMVHLGLSCWLGYSVPKLLIPAAILHGGLYAMWGVYLPGKWSIHATSYGTLLVAMTVFLVGLALYGEIV